MSDTRHVNFTEIGLYTADGFGHIKQTKSLTDLVNDPPLANRSETQLLAILVYQQSAVIQLLKDELKEIRLDVAAIRRDIKQKTNAREQAAKAEEKAAKAEEKAAKARERAALAEIEVIKASEPTSQIQIQAGDNWESLEDRIRRKF